METLVYEEIEIVVRDKSSEEMGHPFARPLLHRQSRR